MTTTVIEEEIVAVQVLDASAAGEVKLEEVSEDLEIPDVLPATRYRLRTPLSSSSIFIVISDIILNKGTEFEKRQPIEIFIMSKDAKAYQYVTTITRLISAVFRKGGDVTFIVEELKNIHDPNGGYLGRGGVWVPSLVAEIGGIIEKHMVSLGLIKRELSKEQKEAIKKVWDKPIEKQHAEQCPSCHAYSYVRQEGCGVCTSCGYSRCG
jgi:hypothetical protein